LPPTQRDNVWPIADNTVSGFAVPFAKRSAPSRRLRVLVADDDADSVAMLAMPDISGYDLARWLRCRHRRSCPLLIAISGAYTQPSDKQLSLTSGFDYYLTKPYRIGELLSLIASPGQAARA
jgi:DNA-binding response OmpR family regulator